VAPRGLPRWADTPGSASAHAPVHRESRTRARSATATKRARAASGGPAANSGDRIHAPGLRCSNSGDHDKSAELAPGVRLLWHGVDTAGFLWRPDDDFFRRLRVGEDTGHLCGFDETAYKTLGEARVIRTGYCSYMLREPLLGVRWGWWSNLRAGHRRLL
jgi:hypothetical protein